MKQDSELAMTGDIPVPIAGATRRAVIDVGTNSVKLLIVDLTANDIRPVWEGSEQTRLGKGFYETHLLLPEAIQKTAEAIAQFKAISEKAGTSAVRVIATSAARDAKNGDQLIAAVKTASGLKLEVISGAQEAEYAFQGVCTNAALADSSLLLLDVGGGSTEFIVGKNRHVVFRESFQLGAVRLLERIQPHDPPLASELESCRKTLRAFLNEQVVPHLTQPLAQTENIKLVGTGGTSTILARMEKALDTYNRDIIESTVLTLAQIRSRVEMLWSLPLAQRQQLIGLPPKRADVVLFGTAIYEAIMEQFRLSQLHISTRGLRYAAVRPA